MPATGVSARRICCRAADVAELKQAGVGEVVAAVLDADDLGEDEAAARIAERAALSTASKSKPAATGRVNIHARAAGVFTVDRALIDAINRIDPAITIATVAEYAAVEAGQMVATVKIIPFAVKSGLVEAAVEAVRGREAFAARPFRPVKVGLIQTVLPGVKDSVLAKTVKVTEARLARSGSRVTAERRTGHEEKAVAEALKALARRQRHRGDVRRVGDERSGRRHSRGDPAGRRRGHPRRHAGRSRQPHRRRQISGQAGARRAGLRQEPQGERLRLGARPADRRHRRQRCRHCRAWRRRAADGNSDAAAAARDGRGRRSRRASMRSCSPPAARAAWAGRTS